MKNKQPINRFNIDFFEFAFLVEACVPPRPIARAMFWLDVINKHYYVLTTNERKRLFEWVNKTYAMENGIAKENEDCLLFNARFDKENQYEVTALFKGETVKYDCFKLGDRYHTSKTKSINEDYITEIKKIVI
jgi:hypothetical protein